MAQRRIVGISGNLTRPSRTRTLVAAILPQAEQRRLGDTDLYDLVDAGPELGVAVQRDSLVVATPVYKAAYIGLLKHLFDLIEPKALEGRPVVLVATGGSNNHALVIEHHLRPLFGFFRAHALPVGLYAGNGDFTPDGELSETLNGRIGPAVDQAETWLTRADAAVFRSVPVPVG